MKARLSRLFAVLALVLAMAAVTTVAEVSTASAFGGCVGYNYHPAQPAGWQGSGGYCSSLNAGESYQIEVFCHVWGSGTYYSHFGPRVFTAYVMSNYLCPNGQVSGGYVLHEYA